MKKLQQISAQLMIMKTDRQRTDRKLMKNPQDMQQQQQKKKTF